MWWRKERAAPVWCLLVEKKAEEEWQGGSVETEEEWQGGSVEKRVCVVL